MTYTEYQRKQAKINVQENKDRVIAEEALHLLLKNGKNLECHETPIKCGVDLKCRVLTKEDKTLYFNVEIKERNKTEEQLKKYPNAELKESKLEEMKLATAKGTKLLYMVLLNQEICMLFDLNKLDWNQVEHRNWRIKKIQYAEGNSEDDYEIVPTYFIPYRLATATLNIKELYNAYYQ